MEKNDRSDQKELLQEVAGKLLKAHQEIDELAVQLSLGKAEALDKFEEIKKEFRYRLSEWKQLAGARQITNIGKLQIQLDMGKAKDPKSFDAQKEKILTALKALKTPAFKYEAEKFKLKLIILQLSLALKKMEIKDEFRQGMTDAKKKIESIADKAKSQLKKGKAKYSDVSDEVQLAFKHMRKAVEKL